MINWIRILWLFQKVNDVDPDGQRSAKAVFGRRPIGRPATANRPAPFYGSGNQIYQHRIGRRRSGVPAGGWMAGPDV
jgi:hypothetical protein